MNRMSFIEWSQIVGAFFRFFILSILEVISVTDVERSRVMEDEIDVAVDECKFWDRGEREGQRKMEDMTVVLAVKRGNNKWNS